MKRRPALQLPLPLYVRLIAVVMSCVLAGEGLVSLITGHSDEHWTRYGYVHAVDGAVARGSGLAIFIYGLLPLVLLMRSPKSAMWFAVTVVVLGFAAVFAGPSLLG